MFKLWILGIFRCYIYQCPTSPVPALYKENLNCKECGHISPALGLGMPAIDLDQIFISTAYSDYVFGIWQITK